MKKKILSRNNNYVDLNIFFPKEEKSQNKILFKTVQEEQKVKMNTLSEKTKKLNFNLVLHNIKSKPKVNQSTNFLFLHPKNKIKNSPNTSRHNHSLKDIIEKKFNIHDYNTGSKIYVPNMIKINKPNLLKILNRDLINNENKLIKNKIKKIHNSFSPFDINKKNIYAKTLFDEEIFDKSTSSRVNKIKNKNILGKEFKTLENNEENKIKNDFVKTYKKFPKINLNFPLELPNSILVDKQEMEDKVNSEYFSDEKLKRKLRKALYFQINYFEYDNGKYKEYKNSMQNYINYIYDINIIPHIKNKFLYRKPIYESRKINNILFSKNVINKEDAKTLNRWLINNQRKKIIEEEKKKKKEKKMKELSISNKYIKELYLEYEDEDLPKLTSDEVVEFEDFFGKNINYKDVNFTSDKLKDVVYKENLSIMKKNKDKLNNNYIRTDKFMINT